MGSGKSFYFLRKDLRLADNRIISHNTESGNKPVLIYLWNEDHFRNEQRGNFYRRYLKNLLDSFKKEAAESGFDFLVVEGSLAKEGSAIISAEKPEEIFIQKQYLPWEIKEEAELKKQYGSLVKIFTGNYLLSEPGEILTNDGNYYKVFTPFYRKWSEYQSHMNPRPETFRTDRNNSELSKRIRQFYPDGLIDYSKFRDFPDKDGTSQLSKHINSGAVSVRAVYALALEAGIKMKKDTEPFIRQLAWRDFYYHLYYNQPEVLFRSFKEKYQNVQWQKKPDWLEAWKSGLTGYPFVDAGMRQLLKEGFMHNRLRMVVASFLTKDLLIDWKQGESHFMQHLKDGDLILNNGGWQWAASTGADAQPYFRIFNPVEQSKKFDRNGDFIRKYVPELQDVPQKYIHEPWKMPEAEQNKYKVVIGSDYPLPIVNHKEQRLKALEMYKI